MTLSGSPSSSLPRVLHLEPSEDLFIRLGPGPSLELRSASGREQWLPLDRIGRILASEHVHWETKALFACLDAGIPVLLLSRGRVIGWCFGEKERTLELDHLLDLAGDCEEDRHLVGDFFRSRERAAMLEALTALRQRTDRFDPGHVRALLANRLRNLLGYPVGALLREAELSLNGVVAETLSEFCHRSRQLLFRDHSWNLPLAMTQVLRWKLFFLIFGNRPRDGSDTTARQWAIRHVAAPTSLLRSLAARLLRDLTNHLNQNL